jgi:hypothetical protein
MAMPSYDSFYYGTSGADGVTAAAHAYAPFPDAAVEWCKLHFEGFVQHPTNPDWFRDSFVYGLFEPDGSYVGATREGYIRLMSNDLIPFMVSRRNFDGHHYSRLEKHLLQEILSSRNPYTGEKLVDTYASVPRRAGVTSYTLPLLINPAFEYASEYLWAKENPTVIASSLDYMMDSSIPVAAPSVSSVVRDNYATFSQDLTDPHTVFMRMKILSSTVPHDSGSALRYFGGGFNIIAFGERLAIDLTTGYGEVEWSDVIRASRQNVILIDGLDDPNYQQVRGAMEGAFLSEHLDYARMRTDAAITPDGSSFKAADVDQTRHVFFPNKRFFIVADALRSGSGSHEYQFTLHGTTGGNTDPGAFLKDLGNDRAMWTKTSGVRLLAQFASDVEMDPADLRDVDYLETPEEPYFEEPYIEARRSGVDVQFLTVLYPLDTGQGEPRINTSSTSAYDAAEIVTREGTVVVVMNGSGGEVEFSGLRTDAEIALVKLNIFDEVEYFGLVEGRTLSYSGDDLVFQGESGDYFGEGAPSCSELQGDCVWVLSVPALPGWGLAVLVVLLSATAGVAVRRPHVRRRMGIAGGSSGVR